MRHDHLTDFIRCYNSANRQQRQEEERFRRFSYDELMARDKTSLNIFWLKDDSLSDLNNLPNLDELANAIVELGSCSQ